MDLWKSILLGLLQGVAEFLPISSSGHLALAEYFLKIPETPRFFDLMLHIGTLVSITLYYRRWLFDGMMAVLKGQATPAIGAGEASDANAYFGSARNLVVLIVLATLPVLGAMAVFRVKELPPNPGAVTQFRAWVGGLRDRSSHEPRLVASIMVCTTIVLALASWRQNRGTGSRFRITWTDALLIGCAQACSAMFPGLSRSGMTISAAMLLGLFAPASVHFSLLMSIPAVLGATLIKFKDVDSSWLTPQNIIATLVGTAVSAVIGYLCIVALATIVKRKQWWVFAVYMGCLAAYILLVAT